jgi:ubiquinone/menaquinone biosynthesis C-methylase UbiE
MATEVALPTAERIFEVVRQLGLERAHFAGREFQEFDGLVRAHPEIIASLTLVCPPRTLNPETLRPLSSRLVCFYGGKGPNAATVRDSMATLPEATRHCLEDYLDVNWADVVADRSDFIGTAMLSFLSRMDKNLQMRPAALGPSEGEIAGISYIIRGSGPPLILLPLVLAPSQWEPLLSRFGERYCTITLGGEELGGVRQLEARGRSEGYRRSLECFVDELKVKPGEGILEIGCGSGVLTRLVAKRLRGANAIMALDINRYFLREARALARKKGLAEIEFREGSAEVLPFSDDTFDVSLSATVMEECDAARMLSEMIRVTKPGGRIGVMVRAEDMNSYVNLPLRPELRAKVERPRGNVSEGGCADASLYGRFHQAGLIALKMFPQLAAFRSDESHGKRLVAGILAVLSPAEANEWRAAADSAEARELLFIARPLHCAVGTKPARRLL